jgi:hypothetical protein
VTVETLLTPEEVSRILATDPLVVRDLIKRGQLGALELAPGDYRVTPGDLQRFIAVRKRDFAGR